MDLFNNSFSKENNITTPTDLSDAYDCINIHIMRPPIKVNSFYSEPIDSTNKQVINVQDFTPNDLQLFMDSIETIAQLRKVKYERRQKWETKQLQKSFENSKKTITYLDSSMIFTSYDEDEDDDNEVWYYEKNKKIPHSLSDVSSCPASLSAANENSLKLTCSPESAEDYIYVSNNQIYHIYEEIDNIYPISNTKIEDVEYSEIYERISDAGSQLMKTSKKIKKTRRLVKKKRGINRANQKFLDKAMRFLSL